MIKALIWNFFARSDAFCTFQANFYHIWSIHLSVVKLEPIPDSLRRILQMHFWCVTDLPEEQGDGCVCYFPAIIAEFAFVPKPNHDTTIEITLGNMHGMKTLTRKAKQDEDPGF